MNYCNSILIFVGLFLDYVFFDDNGKWKWKWKLNWWKFKLNVFIIFLDENY